MASLKGDKGLTHELKEDVVTQDIIDKYILDQKSIGVELMNNQIKEESSFDDEGSDYQIKKGYS